MNGQNAPTYKMVDTCARIRSLYSYYYSCYDEEDEAPPLPGLKAIVVGSGPIRIGQGIEFDYCSVQPPSSSRSRLQVDYGELEPETVSTDLILGPAVLRIAR